MLEIRKPSKLPKSETSEIINFLGLFCAILAFCLLRGLPQPYDLIYVVLILITAFSVPIIILEVVILQSWRRPSTGLDFKIEKQWEYRRPAIKLTGLYFTIALIAFLYWLFPEYHGDFYDNYWAFLRLIVPLLCFFAIPYFIVVDHYQVDPQDGYWQMAMLLFGQFSRIDKSKLGQHVRGWLVKAFFLPLMFTYICDNMSYLLSVDFSSQLHIFQKFYDLAINIIFSIDLLFATTGYILSLRLFDSHIRSTEPTLLGWCVALECYHPFWGFSSGTYMAYSNDYYWGNWLESLPAIYCIWGVVILLLTAIYVYSTVPFGIRFSNLTHRGIFTNGPYRFCKHPAYVSKNLSWWLISIPFISSVGYSEALRRSLLLLGVNIIYFMRARTEERHLSKDPVYIQYAQAMNELSIFAWLGQLFPILQFKPHRLFNIKTETE